jgi:hypothetical protein
MSYTTKKDTYTVVVEDDRLDNPCNAGYFIYDGNDDCLGEICRTFKTNSLSTWGTERRGKTIDWSFTFWTHGDISEDHKAIEFKTYRSAFKAFVNRFEELGEVVE